MAKTASLKLLVPKDTPVLREISSPVPISDIGSKKFNTIVENMKKALHAEDDGVAIAAPQIGIGQRIFVVKGEALAIAKGIEADSEKELTDLIFINPEITKVSKKKKKVEEGCLSLRYLYGHVARHEKVTLKAYDETGRLVTYGASGLLAQIFQHEVDHLDGVLFIDKAENVRDMPPTQDER